MAFSSEDDALARLREKFGDCLGDSGACLVHQRFDLYSSRKSSLFCGSHLRRSQDRRVQIRPPDLLPQCVLLIQSVSMSLSFFACFFCVKAWSGCVQISPPWFVLCSWRC